MSDASARGPATAAEFMAAIRAGDRRSLSRAITLIESTRPDRQALGQEILEGLVAATGCSVGPAAASCRPPGCPPG